MKALDLINTIFTFCIIALLCACDNENENIIDEMPEEEAAVISCSITNLNFDSEAGNNSFTFTTNKEWTATVLGRASWCKLSAKNGDGGDGQIIVSVDENLNYFERNVTVVISCYDAVHHIVVNQKQKDALLLGSERIEVDHVGGQIHVGVKANVDYTLEISAMAKSWIKESKSRAMNAFQHTFVVSPNENKNKREGQIYFKREGRIETVTVYQVGYSPILVLDQNEYVEDHLGGIVVVGIKSNIDFGVKMPDVDWIKVAQGSLEESSHTLKYEISPNDGYTERSAKIVFYDKNSNLEDVLTIIQKPRDVILLSKMQYELNSKKDTIEVEVTSNIDYEVTVSDEWILFVKKQKIDNYKSKLYFAIDENLASPERSGKIVFVNDDKDIREVVDVKQRKKEQSQEGDPTPEGSVGDMTWDK